MKYSMQTALLMKKLTNQDSGDSLTISIGDIFEI